MRRIVTSVLAVSLVASVMALAPVAVAAPAAAVENDGPTEPDHSGDAPNCSRSGLTITIRGTSGDDVLVGTPGDDVIAGLGGNDTIDGRGGNDIIFGDAGDDVIRGGGGADVLCGGSGNDQLDGNAGDDRISGQGDVDTINGGADNDVLFGGRAIDTISGGNGDDLISGGAGDDDLSGDGGADTVFGDSGRDTIRGRNGVDVLWGGAGRDRVEGGNGDDEVYGGDGNDRLFGQADNDLVYGGPGNDRLSGGSGDDTLNGGSGDNDRSIGGDGFDSCESDVVEEDCEDTGEGQSTLTGLSLADLGYPVLDDGTIGGTGGGTLPTPVENPPIFSNPVDAPIDAPNICGSGGLAVRYPSGGQIVQGRLGVPAGVTVEVDIFHRKENFSSSGNWSGAVRAVAINEDGELFGGNAGRVSGSAPFYWAQGEYGGTVTLMTNSGGASQDYILELQSFGSTRITESDGLSTMTVENIRFVADGKDLGPACPFSAANQCAQNGGDLYLKEPIVVDGEVRSGCLTHDSCFKDDGFFLTRGLAEWACRNDPLLADLQVVAGSAVIVLTGARAITVIAPRTSSLAALMRAERGAATVDFNIRGVGAGAGLLGGYLLLPQPQVDVPSISELFADRRDSLIAYLEPDGPAMLADYPELQLDEESGIYVLRGASMIDRITDDMVIDLRVEEMVSIEYPDQDDDSDERRELAEQIGNTFRTAINTCTVLLAEGIVVEQIDDAIGSLQIPIAGLRLPGWAIPELISPQGVITAVGGNRHVCEFLPIYMPGSLSSSTGNEMGEVTLHIAETLGLVNASGWPNPWTGPQPEPNASWALLSRQTPVPSGKRAWLRQFSAEDGGPCSGVLGETECDEFPFNSTYQGGNNAVLNARPHLRILNATHNRVAGSELGNFYAANSSKISCDVRDAEYFLVLPQFQALFDVEASTATEVAVPSTVRSSSVCTDR